MEARTVQEATNPILRGTGMQGRALSHMMDSISPNIYTSSKHRSRDMYKITTIDHHCPKSTDLAPAEGGKMLFD